MKLISILPAGNIVDLIGTSGKLYALNLPYTIAEDYKNSEEFRQEKAQKEGRIYQPGIFTTLPEVLVDSNEKNFTKIIYQDENGKKKEFPIEEITPEIAAPKSRCIFLPNYKPKPMSSFISSMPQLVFLSNFSDFRVTVFHF